MIPRGYASGTEIKEKGAKGDLPFPRRFRHRTQWVLSSFFPFQNLNRTLLKIECVKHQKARSGIVQEEFLYTCHRLMVRLYTLCIYEHGYIYIYYKHIILYIYIHIQYTYYERHISFPTFMRKLLLLSFALLPSERRGSIVF